MSKTSKLERTFQAKLIKTIKDRFPGSYVLKNDPNYIQGIPDLTILLPNGRWATLEDKRSEDAPRQPNQEYYVDDMDRKSFSRFIFPENAEEVLNELEQTYKL